MRRLLLVLALSGCAPVHIAANRPVPDWAYAMDAVVMTTGAVVGVDGGHRRDSRQEAWGFSIAAAFWLPYWLPL